MLTIIPLAAALLTTTATGQEALDRSRIPPPGQPPALHVPKWTRSMLANGATLAVSEKRNLPLVSFSITFQGGASQYEPSRLRGLASITASMLSEGTTNRDAEALSSALQLLGTSININVGSESGSIGFQCTRKNFPQALGLLADMLENPTFPIEALERLREQRIVALTQARDRTASIAARVFPRILYGESHPFGQNVTEASLRALKREDVVSFHKDYFQPGRALVTIVGDVDPSVENTVEQALGGWATGGAMPDFSYPVLPSRRDTTIYLVDKPGAAQSSFSIGSPGPPRSTPDYDALQVMNTVLGGMFQSRLNANIREEKGYSYGVSSSFAFGKGPGAFRAGGDIVAGKSDAALVEFMKELRGIQGTRPITDEELATARDALVQRLPGTFASVQSVNNAIASLWTNGLPDDYYQQYSERIARITKEDVLRVARQYIDLDHLAIVIVGDRAVIEGSLRATHIAPIVRTDPEGDVPAR